MVTTPIIHQYKSENMIFCPINIHRLAQIISRTNYSSLQEETIQPSDNEQHSNEQVLNYEINIRKTCNEKQG